MQIISQEIALNVNHPAYLVQLLQNANNAKLFICYIDNSVSSETFALLTLLNILLLAFVLMSVRKVIGQIILHLNAHRIAVIII
jgi:hypothetical protein